MKYLIIALALSLGGCGDNTDKSWVTHSGMSLNVDYGTGCEYLSTGFGGLTPRLDFNGKQVCRWPHE